MKNFFKQKNKDPKVLIETKGFILIEAMISVSLFIVVVVSGMGVLLNANLVHQKAQDTRSVLDSLSFIMEDMSRNLRTGYNYHCIVSGNLSNLSTPLSGQSCTGVALKDQYGSQLVYNFATGNPYNLSKSTDAGATWVQLNPSEIVIDTTASGFSVLGAEPPAGDSQQPFIIIRLVGTITLKNIVTPFSLQTSVSQRLLDM